MGLFGNFTKPISSSETNSKDGVFNSISSSSSSNTSENKNNSGIFNNFSKEEVSVYWDNIIGKPNLNQLSPIWGNITGTVTDQSDLVIWVNGLLNSYVTTSAFNLALSGKQDSLNGTGFVKINGTTISYDNNTYLTSAITSLNGLTGGIQTFVNDTNITITSLGTTHTIGWNGTLADNRIASASTWNNKQNALNGNGIVKSTSGTISYITDNSSNWDTAYTNRITSLTTTGNSGTATLSSNTLNIPDYNLTGLGGQPLSANLTSLTGLSYTATAFVKMTGANTFSLDTDTYYLASNPNSYTSNLGTVTSVSALTLGTSGTDLSSTVANSTSTPVITLNVPTASATNRGVLSSSDWTTFNNKQSTITIGTIDSQAKVANGLVLTSNILYTQTADATNVGMVSTGTQTFAGAKTFSNSAFSSVVISSGSYTGNNGSHFIVNPTITNNSASGNVTIQTISGTISAGANNALHYGLQLNSTYSAGAFTGTSFYDIQFSRSNSNINYSSGNLTFYSNGTVNFMLRGLTEGFLTIKGKFGNVTGTPTNTLDVGGNSLFGASAANPATASARVHIVGASATTGTALLVTNSTPTTIIRADNNQDLYLGSSGGKIGLFAVTPIVRPTTAIASATYAAGGGAGSIIKTDDTIGGYTMGQVVQALKNLGALT